MPQPDLTQTGVEQPGAADLQAVASQVVVPEPATALPQQTGEPQADAGQTDEQQGQLEALQAEREKRQLAEEHLNQLQQQIQMQQISAQQQQAIPQQVQQQQGVPQNPFDGLDPDDLVSVAAVQQQQQAFAQSMNQQMQQMVFTATHPDYGDVVGVNDPFSGQFKPSEHLTKALTRNPALAMQMQQNPHAAQTIAYEIAKSERELSRTSASNNVTANANQQAAIQNNIAATTAPMPSASVSGGGAVQPELQAMDMDNPLAANAEFEALDAQVRAGKFG